MKKLFLLLINLQLLFSTAVIAQLVGGTTYPINGLQSPPTSFGTVADAFTFINLNGTTGSGDIILEIQAGYTGETGLIPILNAYSGMSAVRPITLKPGVGVNATIRTAPLASAGVIRFNGVQHFTIDGSNNNTNSRNLTIKHQGTTVTTSSIIMITGAAGSPCRHIQVRNCNLVGYSTNTTISTGYGIYMGGATIPTNPVVAFNDSNTFTNNFIQAVNTGIYLRGSNTAGSRDNFNRVVGNTIGGNVAPGGPVTDSTTFIGISATNQSGVWFSAQNNCLISNNVIQNCLTATGHTFAGIRTEATAQFSTNIFITKNIIRDIIFTGTGGWGMYGMRLNLGSSTLFNYNISNNQIINIRSDGFSSVTSAFNPYGIFLEGTSANANVNLFYNSVNMFGPGLNAGGSAALAIAAGITGGLHVVNNIFSNSHGGAAAAGCHAVIYFNTVTTANPFTTINNNIYFANSATSINRLGWIRNAGVTTLAAWQSAATGTGQDANSFFTNPNFVSNTDLTITGTPAIATGQPISNPPFAYAVNDDIRDTARNAFTPSIGSFEIPLTDMTIDSVVAIQNTNTAVVGTNNQVILNVRVNTSGATLPFHVSSLHFNTFGTTSVTDITAARLFYTGTNQVFNTTRQFGLTINSPSGVMNFNDSVLLTFGNHNFWLVYDINPLATINNVVDARFDSAVLSGTTFLPPVSNPAGARTILGRMAGNYTVGVGQNYATITDAINDLNIRGVNAPVTFLLRDTVYNNTTETFPINLISYIGASAVNTVTIRPDSAINLRIVNTTANPTIRISGGNHFIIDGKQRATNLPQSLAIVNTSTIGNAILFINDASHNRIQFARVEGVNNLADGGIVNFSTGIITGNDFNTIDSCRIHSGATFATIAINALGTTTDTAAFNSENIISNNEIFDIWNASIPSSVFRIFNGNTRWAIAGNQIYQTAPRTATAAQIHYVWNLNRQANVNALNGMQITNNTVGGSAPNATGAPFTIGGTVGVRICVAYLELGGLTYSNFRFNRIANIQLNTTDASTTIPGTFGAIWSLQGLQNVENNLIGDTSTLNSIVINTSGNGSVSFPIGTTNTTAGLMNINQNNIGGITVTSPATTTGAGVINIAVSGGTTTYSVNRNVIGGNLAHSIRNINPSTGTGQTIIGIQYSSAAAGTVDSNIIRNFRNNYAGSVGGVVTGIQNNGAAAFPIRNNQIFNLTSNTSNAANAIAGIRIISTNINQNISNNLIYNIGIDTNTSNTTIASGILYNGPTSGVNTISANIIHSIFNRSGNRNGAAAGIWITAGNSNVFNNMVRLGIDTAGASITTGHVLYGIGENAGINNYFHNSVFVGGDMVDDSSNTFAFFSSSSVTAARSILNNVFVNNRSNIGSTAKNYAIRVANTTNLNCNFNIYHNIGVGAIFGALGVATDYPTIASWRGALGIDGNSAAANPNFVNPLGSVSSISLKVQSPTPIESSGTPVALVTVDFEGQDRSAFTPVDIGADAGNYVVADVLGPNIVVNPLPNTNLTTSRVVTATISDPSFVITSGTNKPRIYYRKSSFGSFVNDTGSLVSGTRLNGNWSFLIDPINVGGLTIGDTLYYFLIAQDSSASNNIGSSPGGADATNTASLITPPTVNLSYVVLQSYSGVYTVGPFATFPNLTGATGAFQALNSGIVTGTVFLEIVDNITEPGTVALNALPMINDTLTVRIVPDGITERIVSGSVASLGMIRFNGARNVVVDGRYLGSGRFLKFGNNSTSGPVFHFQNDAKRDTIMYVTIMGNNTATGNLLFGTSTGIDGNDSNVIAYNVFRDTISVPTTHINSSGTASATNSHNQIIGNEFVNFSANAINITTVGNGDNWQLVENKSYNLASRSTAMNIFSLQAGNAHTIRNNYFYNQSAPHTSTINCIQITGSTNNHIIRANQIGGSDTTRAGNMFVTNGGQFFGINVTGGLTGTVIIDSNFMSNFGNVTGSSGVFGIQVTSGNAVIRANTIGFGTNPYDTIENRFDNGLINITGGNNITIENNRIGNAYYRRLGGDRNSAITVTSSTVNIIIRNNIIKDIFSNATSVGLTSFRAGGIVFTAGNTNGPIIEGNVITNIQSTNTATAAYVPGAIVLLGTVNNAVISRNRISNIGSVGTGTGVNAPNPQGILIGGTASNNNLIVNNQISIGSTALNEAVVTAIRDHATAPNVNRYLHNTIFVNGRTATGANHSYGILRNADGALIVENNIIYNKRTTGGTGRNYAVGALTGTILPSQLNYNLFVVNDTTIIAELPSGIANGWSVINSLFAASYNTNWAAQTSAVPADQLFIDTLNGDLGIDTTSELSWYANGKALRIATVSGDFNNASGVRSTSIVNGPVDIGSVEFNTTTLPPLAFADKVPALNDSTQFFFGSRMVAKINWGTVGLPPFASNLRFYTGQKPANRPANSSSMNAYWDFDNAGASGLYSRLTLMHDSAIFGDVSAIGNLRIARYIGTATNWEKSPNTIAQANGYFTADSIQFWGIFTGTDNTNNPLPVRMGQFAASPQNNDVLLNWNTVAEINNLGFFIERSTNGREFESIAFVNGAGNSNRNVNYRHLDAGAFANGNTLYYRLRQVDFDNQYSFSNVVVVNKNATHEVRASVYPNPVQSIINIAVPESNGTYTVHITDIQGKTMFVREVAKPGSIITIEEAAQLQNGVYMISIEGAGVKQVEKFVKTN